MQNRGDHRNGLPCYFHIKFWHYRRARRALCRGTLGRVGRLRHSKQKKPFEARRLTRFEWFELACEVARDAPGEARASLVEGFGDDCAFGMRERHYITA